jgi:hypothetical protein
MSWSFKITLENVRHPSAFLKNFIFFYKENFITLYKLFLKIILINFRKILQLSTDILSTTLKIKSHI